MDCLYLDTETTSLNPGQICELSIIHESNFNFVSAKNYFFAVDSMDAGAQSVHGYSIESLVNLSNGKKFGDFKDELLELMSSKVLVAHNLPFDEKFISSEFWRAGVSFKPAGRLDTMEYFNPILALPNKYKKYGKYKNPKLSEVIDFLKIDNAKVQELCTKIYGGDDKDISYHDSRFDTTAMYVAVNVQRERLHGHGQWTLNFCF